MLLNPARTHLHDSIRSRYISIPHIPSPPPRWHWAAGHRLAIRHVSLRTCTNIVDIIPILGLLSLKLQSKPSHETTNSCSRMIPSLCLFIPHLPDPLHVLCNERARAFHCPTGNRTRYSAGSRGLRWAGTVSDWTADRAALQMMSSAC